jgi:hypothetical protein
MELSNLFMTNTEFRDIYQGKLEHQSVQQHPTQPVTLKERSPATEGSLAHLEDSSPLKERQRLRMTSC